MIGIVPSRALARMWHAATAVLVLLSVGTQLLLGIGLVYLLVDRLIVRQQQRVVQRERTPV